MYEYVLHMYIFEKAMVVFSSENKDKNIAATCSIQMNTNNKQIQFLFLGGSIILAQDKNCS